MIKDLYWHSDQKQKNKFLMLLKQGKIIPVIGSGFTKDCKSKNGKVPSGQDMSNYLIEFVANSYGKNKTDYQNYSFSALCTLYSKRSTDIERFEYFSSNFTEVELPLCKQQFLNVFQKYIYTLNIDDAIERNCKDFHIVLPKAEDFDEYVNNFRSVFKVHGDVHDYLQNINLNEIVFNKKQYIDSLKNNRKILSKFKDDFSSNNLLYIGCSLTDEPDLMSIVSEVVKQRNTECETYYLTNSPLDDETKDLIEDYGITCCIIVDNYDNFFEEIYQEYSTVTYTIDSLELYKEIKINDIDKQHTDAKFLTNSNSIIPVPFNGSINKPYYFIERAITKEIMENLRYVSPIHFVYGHRVSGKSMCLIDIYNKIKDKTRYFFPTGTKIDDKTISICQSKTNCAFIFDTDCLDVDQILEIARHKKVADNNNNYYIIAINSSDKNSLDVLSENKFYKSTCIKNIFDSIEIKKLNKKLQKCNIPTFVSKEKIIRPYRKKELIIQHTILDNLCDIAERFSKANNEFRLPDLSLFSSTKELALLILLGTQQSLSMYELFYFNLRDEANSIVKKYPIYFQLMEFENNLSRFDSNIKLITNSRYYLLKYLGKFAEEKSNQSNILKAYRYIYDQISSAEKDYFIPRKMLDYIRFDVLNDVFYRKNKSVIEVIKYIYEGLEDVMNVNPQFKHQRAKSIFWLCPKDIEEIESAANFVELSVHDIENILKTKYNKSLKISLDHVKYTRANIYGRLCNLNGYQDTDNVLKALNYYIDALNCEENYDEREAIIYKKGDKHIYSDLYELLKTIFYNDNFIGLREEARMLAIDLKMNIN